MIRDGHVTAFYLFDIAEAIALDRIAAIVGQAASPAKLSPKPATPPYVQYQQPPLSFDGAVIGVDDVMGLRVRVRVYDYGIVSFALSRPFTGSWAELIAVGQQLVDNPALEAELDGCCRRLVTRVISALDNPRQTFLFEDYAVFTVTALDGPLTAEALVAEHGADIARLLRGENPALSAQEIESVLHNRLSYLDDDLVIPTWNAAFVYDTEAGSAAVEDIMEFGELAAAAVPLLRSAARRPARQALRRVAEAPAGRTCSAHAATRALRARCTRSPSTSASCSIAPRTR